MGAAKYFTQFGDCHFVENSLFCSLFGLLYWGVLFAPVKGAFSNPFQSRPHDLYEPDFLAQRQSVLAEANNLFKNTRQFKQVIKNRYAEKFAITNHFVHWDALDETLIESALHCIPSAHLEAIFQRIWKDPQANRSGFPDLILFFEDSYQLLEIKGPGDKLQANQLRWMATFNQHQIPHQVVHVEWQNGS